MLRFWGPVEEKPGSDNKLKLDPKKVLSMLRKMLKTVLF
jgi:hypothetical protein